MDHAGGLMPSRESPDRERSHSRHLVEVAHAIAQRLPDADVKAAFLFGSAAWGDADEASDLDIMVLLDRPAGFHEVTRLRTADLLGLSSTPPAGPRFVDLARISAQTVEDGVAAGGLLIERLINAIILKDTAGYLAGLVTRASATYEAPEAIEARFGYRRAQAEGSRMGARAARDGGHTALATLCARLAVQEAAAGLIWLNRDRISGTHFLESAHRALTHFGRGDLYPALLRALGLELPEIPEAPDAPTKRDGNGKGEREWLLRRQVERSLRAYRAFADALKGWMDDPTLGRRLPPEDQAWAVFTWCDETYEEIEHKVEMFTKLGRWHALQYYLDGLLQTPIRINVGKIFLLRSTGQSGRMSLSDFHAALREEPGLSREWVEALRLEWPPSTAAEADMLVSELLAQGELTLENRRAAGD